MSTQFRHHVKLANSLPPKLLRFFARYPPPAILPPAISSHSSAVESTENPPPILPDQSNTQTQEPFNPFEFRKVRGVWFDPVYSLRRQADLVKLARQHGVEELLPPSKKKSETRLEKRVEFGLRVKGTGVGQRVKGHKSERTLKERLQQRRKAMLNMPTLVREWKEAGHGRGWTKWPK